MEEYYRILGLNPDATEEEVLTAYRELAYRYNPDNYSEQRDKDQARETLALINDAFDRVMNYLRRGTDPRDNFADERREFYLYIRRLIQQGQYDTTINQLTAYNNEGEAEWQFLMGSALYYGGYINRSFEHFARANRLEPANSEYASAFNRMSAGRSGNINSSPFGGDFDVDFAFCGDPCTLCQCLMCISCLRH